jgi:hypothetical protein
MADTLETIYLNETLGLTELNDGEHTILTTDAATSYVIKDMYVKNTDFLTSDTRLELNGFDVGSLTSNATGSLIVPPNSTLKVKSSTYPIKYVEESTTVTSEDYIPRFEKVVKRFGETSPEVVIDSVTSSVPFSSDGLNIINMSYNVANNSTPYFYAETHDNNSQQKLYVSALTGSAASVTSTNYIALGTGFKENGDFIGYRSNSNNFYVKDFDAYPTAAPDSSPRLLSTTVNPYPTSSYPRHFFAFDHIWFVPSSSYPTQVYALNVNNGAFKSYTGLYNWGSNSSNNFLTVSHDVSTDKLYIWRMDGTANAIVTEISQTKTEFLADNSSGAKGVVTPGTRITHSKTRNAGWPTLGIVSPLSDGGVMFRSSTNTFESIDVTGETTADPISTASVTVAGITSPVYYYRKSSRVLSTAEAVAAGVTLLTFGIQLLGVKSESV